MLAKCIYLSRHYDTRKIVTCVVWAHEVMHEKRMTESMPVLRFERRNDESAVVCVFEPIKAPTCFTVVDENLPLLPISLSGSISLCGHDRIGENLPSSTTGWDR
jgi:hypothetical protein